MVGHISNLNNSIFQICNNLSYLLKLYASIMPKLICIDEQWPTLHIQISWGRLIYPSPESITNWMRNPNVRNIPRLRNILPPIHFHCYESQTIDLMMFHFFCALSIKDFFTSVYFTHFQLVSLIRVYLHLQGCLFP